MFQLTPPVADDVAVVGIDAFMAFQETLVGLFLNEIDAPVFAVKVEQYRPALGRLHVQLSGQRDAKVVLGSGIGVEHRKRLE